MTICGQRRDRGRQRNSNSLDVGVGLPDVSLPGTGFERAAHHSNPRRPHVLAHRAERMRRLGESNSIFTVDKV